MEQFCALQLILKVFSVEGVVAEAAALSAVEEGEEEVCVTQPLHLLLHA